MRDRKNNTPSVRPPFVRVRPVMPSPGRGWMWRLMFLLMLLAPHTSCAEEVTATAYPADVAVGDELTYSVMLETSSSSSTAGLRIERPDFNGFDLLGQSQRTEISNFTSLRYHVDFVLRARAAGVHEIAPARVHVGGKFLSTNRVRVTVRGARASSPKGGAASSGSGGGATGEEERDPTLFLHAAVSTQRVYVGEPFSYYSALLSQRDIGSTELVSEMKVDSFVVEDLDVNRQLRPGQFGGRSYRLATELSKKILIPAAPGRFTIQPEVLSVGVKVPERGRRRRSGGLWPFGGDDPFDDPFFNSILGRNYRLEKRTVTAPPLTVVVRDLPNEGKPPDFEGTIARSLTMIPAVDREEMVETDALTFRLIVAGKGDIRAVPEPRLDLGNAFKVYESKVTPKVTVDMNGISGEKTFEYVLVPSSPGKKTLPPAELTYFDADSEQYRTLKTPAITVRVLPGEKDEALASIARGDNRSRIEVLAQDLRFIEEGPEVLKDWGAPLHQRNDWRAAMVAPLMILALAGVVTRRRRRLEGDVGLRRRSRALRRARQSLGEAEEAVESGSVEKAYTLVHGAILAFIGDKLNVSHAGLVAADVGRVVAGRGAESEQVERLEAILKRCEQVRFAPGEPDVHGAAEIIAEARELLGTLDGKL